MKLIPVLRRGFATFLEITSLREKKLGNKVFVVTVRLFIVNRVGKTFQLHVRRNDKKRIIGWKKAKTMKNDFKSKSTPRERQL